MDNAWDPDAARGNLARTHFPATMNKCCGPSAHAVRRYLDIYRFVNTDPWSMMIMMMVMSSPSFTSSSTL